MINQNLTNLDLQTNLLARSLGELFEHLPDTYFFVKDRESKFLHANGALLERIGLRHLSEIIGTSDRDRYPEQVASQLIQSDRQVIDSGEPLIDHADVLYDHNGRLEWFSTTKYPVRSVGGGISGVAGFTRSFSKCSQLTNQDPVAGRVIHFVCENPTCQLRVSELAKRFGISERQLHRQFLKVVKMSPRDFILRTRIQSAAADLRFTSEAVASLADKYGFCDQSSFTRQFRSHLGITPAAYRKRT
ncbi:MAG: AraC family transcriptional regulator [Verrucomicrobiales bacterium]|nr:AraC family transcriptional regulator [Verrucomicrobiales bacterium]